MVETISIYSNSISLSLYTPVQNDFEIPLIFLHTFKATFWTFYVFIFIFRVFEELLARDIVKNNLIFSILSTLRCLLRVESPKVHFQLNKVSFNPYLWISQPLKLQSSISPKEISIKILLTTSHEQKQTLLFKEIHNGIIRIRWILKFFY